MVLAEFTQTQACAGRLDVVVISRSECHGNVPRL